MAGKRPARAEIFASLHEPASEHQLPGAINRDAREHWIFWRSEPACQAEPIARSVLGKAREKVRCVSRNIIPRSIIRAAFKNMRGLWRSEFVHGHQFRNRIDRASLIPAQ